MARYLDRQTTKWDSRGGVKEQELEELKVRWVVVAVIKFYKATKTRKLTRFKSKVFEKFATNQVYSCLIKNG